MNKNLNYNIGGKKIVIYLKKGRFLLLFFIIAGLWQFNELNYTNNGAKVISTLNVWQNLLVNFPLILNVLVFALIIIPFFFKTEKYVQFWISILLLISFCVLIEWVILFGLNQFGTIEIIDSKSLIFLLVKKHTIIWLSGSSILYFIEQIIEIQLMKEIRSLRNEKAATLQKTLGTKTELPFMIRGLRNIKNLLQNNKEEGSEAILSFADVLRYKLYDYEAQFVSLKNEIEVLKELLRFMANKKNMPKVSLQIEGNIGSFLIIKSSLLNIIAPIFHKDLDEKNQFHIFILADEALDLVIECLNIPDNIFTIIHDELAAQSKIYGYLPNDITEEENKKTIHLCQPAQK